MWKCFERGRKGRVLFLRLDPCVFGVISYMWSVKAYQNARVASIHHTIYITEQLMGISQHNFRY